MVSLKSSVIKINFSVAVVILVSVSVNCKAASKLVPGYGIVAGESPSKCVLIILNLALKELWYELNPHNQPMQYVLLDFQLINL